jgi:hypothetical protein
MKNGRKLGKFWPELERKFAVFSETFLNESLSMLTKFHVISFRLGPKSFSSHEFHTYLIEIDNYS